jgi:hypothetical protein
VGNVKRLADDTARAAIERMMLLLKDFGELLPCSDLADLARTDRSQDLRWLVDLIQAPTCSEPGDLLQGWLRS